MQKIVPHLWFDNQAVKAAEFYSSVFPDTKIISKKTIHDTPSGDCDIVEFQIMGFNFVAISAGPLFKINPSISFHIRCNTIEKVDDYYEKLSKNGNVLMELNEYPFSKKYAWVEDAFGVSWQIIHTKEQFNQHIVPAMLFTKNVCGKAREAIKKYVDIFPDSQIKALSEYGKNEFGEKENNIMFAEFTLANETFIAMDSGLEHAFTFNEAVSFIINCKDQQEIDYFWEKLSAVSEAEQCGWVKDTYGVSWQIIPEHMSELTNTDTKVQAMLKMKKIIIEALENA